MTRDTTSAAAFRRWLGMLVASNLLIIGGLLVVTVMGLRSSRASDEVRARDAAQSLARSLAGEISAELRQVDNALVTVARHARHVGLDSVSGRRDLENVLIEQGALLPHVNALRVADASGRVVLGGTDGMLWVADRGYFQAASASDIAVVSEPIQSRVTGRWGIVVARGIRMPGGRIAGVVFAGIDSAQLAARFRRQAIGEAGAISLRSSSLRLVARHVPGETDPFRGIGSSSVSAELEKSIAESPDQGWFRTRTAIDGVERVSAYVRLHDYPLVLLAGLGTEDFLARWKAEVRQQTGLLVLVALMIVGMSCLLFQRHRREHAAHAEIARLAHDQAVMLDNDLVGMARVRGRTVVWKNRALDLVFGYGAEELLQTPMRALYLDDETYERVGKDGYDRIRNEGRFRTQVRMRRRDGAGIWIDLSGARMSAGETLWMMTDITALKDSEAMAQHLALHDALTGLPNRLRLDASLSYLLSSRQRTGGRVAVCCMDLDGFKAINDLWGHAAGDAVLREVSARLSRNVRPNDLVARVGGDEFAILLTNLQGDEEIRIVLERILVEVARPIELPGGQEGRVSASIGVAVAPNDGEEGYALLQVADAAMYVSKRRGKNRISRRDELDGRWPAVAE